VREIVAAAGHRFALEGANRTAFCRATEPHPPHVLGRCDALGYEGLDRFCLGREGLIPGQGTLHIVVTSRRSGLPECPSTAEGYWFIEAAQQGGREETHGD